MELALPRPAPGAAASTWTTMRQLCGSRTSPAASVALVPRRGPDPPRRAVRWLDEIAADELADDAAATSPRTPALGAVVLRIEFGRRLGRGLGDHPATRC